MDCPRCGDAMREEALGGHHRRRVTIDLCTPCQAIWFDTRESLSLTPASTLALFRLIGQRVHRPEPRAADLEQCPRCRGRLRRTQGMQRATRFEYLRCPNDHGRFITFYEFLREKDLTPQFVCVDNPSARSEASDGHDRRASGRMADTIQAS